MMRLAALGAVLAIGGCDGAGVVGPGSTLIARTGASTANTSIAGTWRRTLFFLDEFNNARSSETSWSFGADGTVVRVQVARNHTFGLVDVVVSSGRWRMQGAQVEIEFTSPPAGSIVLDVRVTGDQLDLAGQTYLRVTG